MGLCLADSLLSCGSFDAADFALRLVGWERFGYNNAFGLDDSRASRRSVGLSGTVGAALTDFVLTGRPVALPASRCDGNGSITRLAPVAARFWDCEETAVRVAREQSRVTHRAREARECAALLASAMVRAINSDVAEPRARKADVLRSLVDFKTSEFSVAELAGSNIELFNDGTPDVDRDWRWRAASFRYSPSRVKKDPGHVGGS